MYYLMEHCKPKPCKAHRELPVSQFPQGKPCFHYRGPLFSLQGPCFHYRDFPVNPCTSLLGIAVLGCNICTIAARTQGRTLKEEVRRDHMQKCVVT